jgi:transposase-like protein
VAVETPLVLVLDDLHWADGATLGLLTHLAREIGRARILVCGTYRDTDLDRRHPLAQALADLGREDLFSRISLRGLSLAETDEYVRQTANVEPGRGLVERIYEETEGNPFFLSEVVNLMTEEGGFSKASVSDIAVPEGVRQALGRRLDRLSEEANELLTVLAVAGRDFDHALVQALSGHDDAITLQLLEQALRARVLEEVGAARHRFSHALTQETLLAELSAARRVLLHGQIAEAMERLYGDSRDSVAKLSFRDVAELLLQRGFEATHETVREWESRFAPLLADRLRSKRYGRASTSWYLDETYVKVAGRWCYLYRAIDRDGQLIDSMLSEHRDKHAARQFLRRLIEIAGRRPARVTTDHHPAYRRAIRWIVGRGAKHRTTQYVNNYTEQSHRAIKQRYYPMLGFGSFESASRFCTAFEELRHYLAIRWRGQPHVPLAEQRRLFSERWRSLIVELQAA